ncbi:MAG: TetR family transcriptional regulator [Deltaproteobacteria bacterium]|nr:MAG: TetR family transcriptional regulator [Deltaproteobacteria bacterium]
MSAKRTVEGAKPTERRPYDAGATREAILTAATRCFAEGAYETVGLRKIAALADADPALVSRYFGSKLGLYRAAIARVAEVCGAPEAIAAGLDGFGARLARATLLPQDPQWTGFVLLMQRATLSPTTAEVFAEHLEATFLGPLVDAIGGEDARRRAGLILSTVLGAAAFHFLIAPGRMTGDDLEGFVRHIAETLQRYATP